MHPLIAVFVPIIVLGLCIAFLLIRMSDQAKIILSQKKKLEERAPSIIKRDATKPPFPEQVEAVDAVEPKKTTPAPKAEPAYFDSSDSLLATLSHELKTPLNGIMGIAQVLREENEHSDHLIELEGCAHHMHSVLHTLTNLARIQNENEYLPQFREWVSLRDVIEQIKEDVTFRAAGRRLQIQAEHENNRLRLRGDSDHIETIIKSIILGSIESVPLTDLVHKRATLAIEWTSKADTIELTIDNPNEELESTREQSINEILNLARGSQQSRVKIQYLHIAVAKALLDFYNGSIQAESLPEGGVRTTVQFTMEQMIASPSAAKPLGGLRVQSGKSGIKTLRALPEKMRILIAEDDQVSRNLLLLLLEKMEQDAKAVENGELAVLELQQTPSYDLILMDVDMPIMDGMAAAQAIRNGLAGDEIKDIPIAAVTAFNVISDRNRFKEAGMDYYLRKPVDLKELRATLLEIVKKKKEA